jgi:hypothetical protein
MKNWSFVNKIADENHWIVKTRTKTVNGKKFSVHEFRRHYESLNLILKATVQLGLKNKLYTTTKEYDYHPDSGRPKSEITELTKVSAKTAMNFISNTIQIFEFKHDTQGWGK